MVLEKDSSACEWRVPDLLEKKSMGEELTEDEVKFLVRGICDHSVDDCQLGAFLMCVKHKSMTRKEQVALTVAMRDSGVVPTWPEDWVMVDKHSTGGVGDKTSLAMTPAVAALGLKVPMISGRGLMFTGGTLDKLESIPGYRVYLNKEEMIEALREAGCCIVGQTENIVPADRRMYAARDVTATVKSVPLIVGSIIGKKSAETLKSLVLDVKFGRGAFMKTQEEAEELAREMVEVGRGIGMKTTAAISLMDNPTGRHIGNALEVREALECLHGRGPKEFRELVVYLGGELAYGGGVAGSEEEGRRAIEKVLDDGSALKTFCKMLQKQGVTAEVANALCDADNPDYSILPTAAHVTKVLAPGTGVVTSIDAMSLAKVNLALGAGRNRVGEEINYSVGIVLLKVLGEKVNEGEAWAALHHDKPLPQTLVDSMQQALTLSSSASPFSVPNLVVACIK